MSVREPQILRATEINTRTAGVLKEFATGQRHIAVIQRRGKPVAAMISMEHLSYLLAEIEKRREGSSQQRLSF